MRPPDDVTTNKNAKPIRMIGNIALHVLPMYSCQIKNDVEFANGDIQTIKLSK